ncbi:MAG TPA: phosphoribosylanthranilate isomerase, partial [Verrucomicrobiae bacterium]|nr:phosphoribosylanthranilate isomerase [Verrucomicrobiae bacterium]
MSSVRVKICGITSLEDALQAADAGADALGFIFHPPSPRYIDPKEAAAIIRDLPPFVQTVGVFVNVEGAVVEATAARCGLGIVQLHGDESPEYCEALPLRKVKSLRVRDEASVAVAASYRVAALLLDTYSPHAYGGTGETFNWEIAQRAAYSHRIILAGGLNPENVAAAVSAVSPYAVDVCGGVERA